MWFDLIVPICSTSLRYRSNLLPLVNLTDSAPQNHLTDWMWSQLNWTEWCVVKLWKSTKEKVWLSRPWLRLLGSIVGDKLLLSSCPEPINLSSLANIHFTFSQGMKSKHILRLSSFTSGIVAMLCYYKADPDEGCNDGMAAVPPLLPLTLILKSYLYLEERWHGVNETNYPFSTSSWKKKC